MTTQNLPEQNIMSNGIKDEGQSSDSSDSNDKKEGVAEEANAHEYVTGVRLVIILGAVTIVFFLLMLDMSIITNVRPYPPQTKQLLD